MALEVGVRLTFRLRSPGERLAVIPAAVRHDGPRPPRSRALALLDEAPDGVEGSAALAGERSTLSAKARGVFPPCSLPWAGAPGPRPCSHARAP